MRRKVLWGISGMCALCIGFGSYFATSVANASPSSSSNPGSSYQQMIQYRQNKQAELAQMQQQRITNAHKYVASHPGLATAVVTSPPLPSKPTFRPTQLDQQAWMTLPWINRQDKQYPTSSWLVDYVSFENVGMWEPEYALSGANSSGEGYITLANVVPTGGTQTENFNPPQSTGAITITGVSNGVISFSTVDNQTGTFDFQSHQWTINS